MQCNYDDFYLWTNCRIFYLFVPLFLSLLSSAENCTNIFSLCGPLLSLFSTYYTWTVFWGTAGDLPTVDRETGEDWAIYFLSVLILFLCLYDISFLPTPLCYVLYFNLSDFCPAVLLLFLYSCLLTSKVVCFEELVIYPPTRSLGTVKMVFPGSSLRFILFLLWRIQDLCHFTIFCTHSSLGRSWKALSFLPERADGGLPLLLFPAFTCFYVNR